MSPDERISAEEARDLLAGGHSYLDVRSIEEFDAGHVPGAYNVPLRLKGAAGMVDNPDFLAVVAAHFPSDAPLVVGCQSGARSAKAVGLLSATGYTRLKDLRTGYGGTRDAFGRHEPGWTGKGLPVEVAALAGRSYAELRVRQG